MQNIDPCFSARPAPLTPVIESTIPPVRSIPPASTSGARASPAAVTWQPGVALVEPLTGMTLLWVPPGTFLMGSSKTPGTPGYDREAYDAEKPAHPVTLTQGFYIAQHPVTNAAYQRYVRATGAPEPGPCSAPVSTAM